MSHRNRKSRNKSVLKNTVPDSGSSFAVSSEEISRNSSALSSDSTSVQPDFSDFFDDIKNSYNSVSSVDEDDTTAEAPGFALRNNDSPAVFSIPAEPADTSSVPDDAPAAVTPVEEDSIDFSSFSWKDDLYQTVGYAPEADASESSASVKAKSPPVSDADPEPQEVSAPSFETEAASSFRPLSSALSYDDEPGLSVPQSPRFLSFVDNDDNTLFENASSIQDVFPSASLQDIIAELSAASGSSSSSEASTETPADSVVSGEPLPDAYDQSAASDSDTSDADVPYTLADILQEAAGNRYISPDDIRSAVSGNPYSSRDKKAALVSGETSAVSAGSDIREKSSSPAQEEPEFDFDRDFDSLLAELSDVRPESSGSPDTFTDSTASGYALDSILSGISNLAPDDGPQIDNRFNLSGKTDDTIRFGGVKVDISADPSYNPQIQEESYKSGYQNGKKPKDSSGQFGFLNGFLGRRDSGKLKEVRDALSGKNAAESSESDASDDSSIPSSDASFDSIVPVSDYDFSYTPDQSAFESSEQQSSEASEADAYDASVDDIIRSFNADSSVPSDNFSEDDSSESDISVPARSDAPTAEETPEEDTPAEGYLNDTDYDYSDPDGDDFESPSEGVDYFPSTFREYILTGITAFLYKMRPGARAGSATVEDKTENLGQEVSPAKASKYYGSFSTSLRNRLRLSIILLLIMAYVSVGLPCTGMLKTKTGSSEFCLAAQLTIMMLSLDVVTAGIMDIVRKKPGAASLAVVSCVFTSLDVFISAVGKTGTLHTPLCVLSSFSLVGILFASLLHSRGMRKALRVPAISKRAYTVTGEMNVKQREITLLKSVRPSVGFVRRAEEAAPDEEFFIKASPFIFILAVILGIILTIAEKSFSDLIYYISAVLAASVPFTALIAYALPFYLGSVSIFSSGAAIAGWSGLSDIGRSKNLVVTDRDLFPDGSVDFESIRIFADEDTEKVISYAGTMVTASGSCLSVPFADLMTRNNCRPCRVEHFEYLSGGGMKGIIEGDVVVFGNCDMLRLMNVRVPFRLVTKTTALLAINGVLYGIFDMKYSATPSVREALIKLIRSDRHPIFAIRDFNITPELLHDIYDLATDGYDFPPYIERYRISAAEPTEDSKIAAVVCREGLGPLTHLADTGHSMYRSVVANCIITAACTVIGMFAMFISVLAAGSVSVKGFFLFMIISSLPVFFISVFMKD